MTFKLNGGSEYWLRSGEQIWFYDFVFHPAKLIIEYNGEHVHADSNMSTEKRAKWRHSYNGKTAAQIEEADGLKTQAAVDKKFSVLFVWSKRESQGLEQCLTFIRNYHANQNQTTSNLPYARPTC